MRQVSAFRRNKEVWGPDAYEFRPERWLNVNEKPESPVGVYGNLCVLQFYAGHMYYELRLFDLALPSPEAPGVALGGGSRKSYRDTVKSRIEMKQLIDWLFAADSITELHTFLVTLVRQFDFSLPDHARGIKSTRAGGISPIVVGEEHKGPQMPLKVTILENE